MRRIRVSQSERNDASHRYFKEPSILALASRAFAFYYMLQCLVASSLAKSTLQRRMFGLLAAVLAFITLFAVAAG